MINRRHFLGVAGLGLAGAALRPLDAFARPTRTPGPVIEKFTVLRVPGAYYRPIAMNAYDRGPKGQGKRTRLLRVFLSDGTVGLGVTGYRPVGAPETTAFMASLIGVNPMDIYQWQGDTIRGFASPYREKLEQLPFAFVETPLLDAVAKLKDRPVWALYGPRARGAIDCYDGTLYFKDVELETDASIIGELAARIQGDGYKALKMKVGRPGKWMPGEAGVERDIEAVIAAREAVGRNFNVMLDANNGYKDRFDWTMRFLKGIAPYDPYWIEEIFPEDVETYRRLRRAMYEAGFMIPIADGENMNQVDRFPPYLEAGIFEFIQPDMRTAGFTNILRAADMAEAHGAALVPHNWRSEIGKLMSIHSATVHPNILFAEDDRYKNAAVDSSGYLFRDGQWIPPEAPGWGFEVVAETYERIARSEEEMVIS